MMNMLQWEVVCCHVHEKVIFNGEVRHSGDRFNLNNHLFISFTLVRY